MSAKNSEGVKDVCQMIRNISAENSEGENGLNVTVETKNDIKRNKGRKKSLLQCSAVVDAFLFAEWMTVGKNIVHKNSLFIPHIF